MSYYTNHASGLGWGPSVARLNPEKTSILDQYAVGKVIDIGCGSGIYANYLASDGYEVFAIDKQKKFIHAAKKKYPLVKFQVASAYKLPFKNDWFQTAILFDIIEHLNDTRVLKEASRVARRLIISVPHTNQKILTQYSLLHRHYEDRTHQRTYTANILKKKLKSVGLSVKIVKPAMPISLSGIFVTHISGNNKLKKLLLKVILKPFLPEKPIYSTVFGVGERE